MINTLTQVTDIPRLAGNVAEPVLTATVGSTISRGLANPVDLGLSATQAGVQSSSERKL